MVYDHIVKFCGVYYKAGEDVPNDKGKVEEPKGEISSAFVEETAEPEPVVESVEPVKTHTKSEISLMNKADLQSLAYAEGIDGAYDKSAAELKKLLVKHFGL